MNRYRAHAAIFLVNLFYGANFTIAKMAMPLYISPSAFILLRVSVALLLFQVVEWTTGIKTKIDRRDYPRLFLLGLFGVAVNQLLFFEGLAITSNINAALIMTSNPVLVMIAAALIIRERITARRVSGIALGIAGAALLILLSPRNGSASIAGDTMIFINAFSYAIYLVMIKPLMTKYHPWLLVKWTFLFGLILVAPFGWNGLSEVDWSGLPVQAWTGVIYVILFTTFFAYLLTMYGLRYLSPSVVSFYIYLQPVFATLITLIMTQEPVTLIQVIACMLIFSGVYLVSGNTFAKAKS
jgi:drug/metabolite transporter (DMT)-like permease